MAKETTTLDEELYDGIQKARKKKALNFCLIGKGPEVLKLIVQKKKISDGMASKAKSEAKGSLIVTGVVIGEGVELTFEVTGEEPSIKAIKLKEFIADQTDLSVKAKWAVVKDLREVKDDDDVPPAPPQPGSPQATTATPTPPVAPPKAPEAADELAELKAKLKELTPKVQAAIVANPANKDKLLGGIGSCKQQIKGGNVAGAKESLIELLKLLNEKPSPTTPPQAPPQTPPQQTQPPQTPPQAPPTSQQQPPTADAAYAKAKARFAAARGTWIKVKDQAVANIHTIRDGMVAEYKDVPADKDNLARGVAELNKAAERFNDELKQKFDAFTADPPPPPQARDGLKKEVLALIDAYRQEIESNVLYEALDQKEFAPVLVKAPLLKALQSFAKDLA